jgi:hypothetical protein
MIDVLLKMENSVAQYLARLSARGVGFGPFVMRAYAAQRELVAIRLRLEKKEITQMEATLLAHDLMLRWGKSLNEGSPL